MGAGGQVKFAEYLKNLGLKTEPKEKQKTAEVKDANISKEEAIAKAEGILEKARKKKAEK